MIGSLVVLYSVPYHFMKHLHGLEKVSLKLNSRLFGTE